MAERRYHTKQRDSILAYFAKHPDACLSAKDIIESPEIAVGEATVFRCLAHLTAEGRLKKYVGAGGGALYQYQNDESCNSHFHLKCLICGEIVHLDCRMMQDIGSHIAEHHDFTIDISRTVIYGFCKTCREQGLVAPDRLTQAEASLASGECECHHHGHHEGEHI